MATLKISDLSVGDWVRYKPECGNQRIAKITEIHWNCVIGEYNGVECAMRLSNIEPIPITAEILEKNGWAFHKSNQWWTCQIDEDTRVNVWLGGNGECRVEVSVLYGESRTWSNYADVKLANAHIHLLQRALRLAGVDKEINL